MNQYSETQGNTPWGIKLLSFSLPMELVEAMTKVETGKNPLAMRFEPLFYDRYLKGKPLSFVPPGCSKETEAIG